MALENFWNLFYATPRIDASKWERSHKLIGAECKVKVRNQHTYPASQQVLGILGILEVLAILGALGILEILGVLGVLGIL